MLHDHADVRKAAPAGLRATVGWAISACLAIRAGQVHIVPRPCWLPRLAPPRQPADARLKRVVLVVDAIRAMLAGARRHLRRLHWERLIGSTESR